METTPVTANAFGMAMAWDGLVCEEILKKFGLTLRHFGTLGFLCV